MASFYFRVILCRIRIFSTLISKIKWLGSGLPLRNKHYDEFTISFLPLTYVSDCKYQTKTSTANLKRTPIKFTPSVLPLIFRAGSEVVFTTSTIVGDCHSLIIRGKNCATLRSRKLWLFPTFHAVWQNWRWEFDWCSVQIRCWSCRLIFTRRNIS